MVEEWSTTHSNIHSIVRQLQSYGTTNPTRRPGHKCNSHDQYWSAIEVDEIELEQSTNLTVDRWVTRIDFLIREV